MILRRRDFLAALSAIALPAHSLRAQQTSSNGTQLFLLGTAGGPRPRRARSGSAQAIVSGGKIYVIDCGDGVARQLVLAGLRLKDIRHIFITHHHSDHNIDFGTLVHLALLSGLTSRLDCSGPPPTEQMLRSYFEYQRYDLAVRMEDEGRADITSLVHANDIREAGLVWRDENVAVTAARVPHPPIELAFAYRFDAADRSIVISGDTLESEALVRLAKGADVLVHEVMIAERVREMLRPLPNNEKLVRSVLGHHTTAEQAGRVAAKAGVKLLVLSHLVPAEDPNVPDEEWIAQARRHYDGPVIVGRDLMKI